MKVKIYSLAILMAFGASQAFGQTIKKDYVESGVSSPYFLDALDSWTSTGKVTNDDHFYVSRIKSKARFRNTATQVMTTLTDANDKRLCCWLPWEDDEKGVGQNALPHGNFDTEVFSMWQYVSHWGDWNAALGRVPAALLDVAHKNGVSVSGTGVTPNGAITGSHWETYLSKLTEAKGAQAAKMFYYFGDDGMGYNSEFSTSTSNMQNVIAFHKRLMKDLRDLGNVNAESMWYEGTTTTGSITFNNSIGAVKELYGTADNPIFSMFTDYKSMTTSVLSGIVTNGNSYGPGGLRTYAGCNIQTGLSGGWQTLKDYAVSIGLWGAHKQNMFFQQRYRGGSSPAAQQRGYILSIERWFGGGYRNPVKAQTPFHNLNYSPQNITKNPGMCSMMSARSTLQWDLSEEPFVTFFNLGNGTFLNYKGVRANNNEWGNVGVQDYLPTWRFWFHNSWLGRDAAGVPEGIDAQFVWDDAYVGGSCLELAGTASNTYLHLFKTQFALQAGDVITVRYKLAQGSGDIDLAFSTLGAESTVITDGFKLLETSQHHDSDVWVEKTYTVGDGNTLAGKTIAMIALKFNSLNDAKLYLGEVSIVRGTPATPAAPENLTATVVYKGVTGIDAKLIWDMPGKKALPEPTFNLDVNTSLFKIWAQIDDKEPILQALTTSWAGFSFQTPTNGSKVRFGVSAISTDFASESDITWSDWQTISDLTLDFDDNIQISKSTIHPGDEFTISYVEPSHEAATWTIKDSEGVTKATGTGTSITTTLDDEGFYDLVVEGYVHEDGVTATASTITYSQYITISASSTGSIPEILTFTLDGKTEGIKINKNEDHTLAFTAKNTDGKVSTGVRLQSRFFGPKMSDTGIQPSYSSEWASSTASKKANNTNTKSWTMSMWIKPSSLSGSWLNIVNPNGAWPRNNWGKYYAIINPDGTFTLYCNNGSGSHSIYGRHQLTYDAQLAIDKWTHIAFVSEWKTDGYLKQFGSRDSLYDEVSATAKGVMRTAYVYHPHIYVNGKKLDPIKYEWQSVEKTDSIADLSEVLTYTNKDYAFNFQSRMHYMIDSYIMMGGPTRIGGFEGTVDHFQIYNKVLTDAEVLATMEDATSAPAGCVAYWDFDNNEIDSDYGAISLYGSAKPKIYLWDAEAGATEGENNITPRELDLVAGYPFLSANHEVNTQATWDVPGADIKSPTVVKGKTVKAAGDEITGSAIVSWPTDAVRDITLTLSNDFGSDSKTITAVQVGDAATGIDDIWSDPDKLQIIHAQDCVVVRVGEAGFYNFALYTADGRRIDGKADNLGEGNSVTLYLPNTGIYILSIEKDGKLYNGYKFVRQ